MKIKKGNIKICLSKQGGSVGLSIYAFGLTPYTNSKDDEIATQRAKAFIFGWMLDPLVFGDYPDEMKKTLGSRLPVFLEEESEQLKGSSDFIGIIHYTSVYVTNQPTNSTVFPNMKEGFFKEIGVNLISIGNDPSIWAAVPWGLEVVLEYIKQSYNNPPIYILENGMPMEYDPPTLQDTQRVEYIQSYIGAMLNAIKNGSDTRGYFVWSMIDLYEFLNDQTFGMYYVNFSDPDRKRTPKLSAYWYTGFLNGTVDVTSSQDMIQLKRNISGGSSSL